MTIPYSSHYPDYIDSDDNLFLTRDSLRVRLRQDYNPGDVEIYVEGDPAIFALFPPTGNITLTEQCSDIAVRAVSFHYTGVDIDNVAFTGLEVLPGFVDVPKPKRLTHVTQNVMASHHNNIKNAVMAIQNFVGLRGTTDHTPLGPTIEGRINYLRKLVLTPKAWFSVDKTIGLVPFTVTFTDKSFRLGTDETANVISHTWDFGDNTSPSVTTIVENDIVPINATNVLVSDPSGGAITKTYTTPGIYNVSLTVKNKYGSDQVIFPALINARVPAPSEAVVSYNISGLQTFTYAGVPAGGPYTSPPVIRTPTDDLITMEIPSGRNPGNLNYSYAGEQLDGQGRPIDPVVSYSWGLEDDLPHSSTSPVTKASYSIGGVYDMKVRLDTRFGSYRITKYPASIDVVEQKNLWFFTIANNLITSYEYGLTSETFKVGGPTQAISRNESFLSAASSQQRREFEHNTVFAPAGSVPSGSAGTALLGYASGRASAASASTETVNFLGFNGFTGIYDHTVTGFSRPWNWAAFVDMRTVYFYLGNTASTGSPLPQNPVVTEYDLSTYSTTHNTITDYRNGAEELLNAPGDTAVYRSAWKNLNGFLVRNDGVGDFFRIKSFYKTEGTVGTPMTTVRKLIDIPGPTKLEGEFLAMTPGIFFFNNSGSLSAYNDTTGIWETGGPGVNSVSFRSLQDLSQPDFDDASNTLLGASDGDSRAYLSFDYSSAAFIKFNSIDLTYNSLSSRPSGTQWMIGIY